MNSLLDELYRTNPADGSTHEKTAEAKMVEAIVGESSTVEESPIDYSTMSTEELAALALQVEQSSAQVEEEIPETVKEAMEKAAADTLGGQVMAHAMIHEFGLIKEALAHGLCRVCKEKPLDVAGSTICSACGSE
jgi:hypothetical protein